MTEIQTALAIAPAWALVGAKLPKDVLADVARLEAVVATTISSPVVPVTFKPEDAQAAVDELAGSLALITTNSTAPMPSPETTPKGDARRRIMLKLAIQIREGAAEAVPAAIEAVTPAFDKAAEAYSLAIDQLPRILSSDAIVEGGPEVSAAYEAAKSAATELAAYDAWASSLLKLGITGDFRPWTLITDPETFGDFQELREADTTSARANQVIQAINPVWRRAVHLSVPFRILCDSERVQEPSTVRDFTGGGGISVMFGG